MEDNQIDPAIAAAVIEASERRRAARRRFLIAAGQTTAVVGGLALISACGGDDDDDNSGGTPTPSPTPTATPTAETNVLNFALNLEYLEAQFYSVAAFGTRLDAALLTGSGTAGAVTGGRQVTFTDPVVAQYAREIAYDEVAHVQFLRAALGSLAVAQPALNIDGGATGAFSAAARAAGVVPAGGTFDPYASDENFLLAAYLFEDVGVTAYKGGIPTFTTKPILEATAGLLAAESYHAGLVRSVLYRKGIATPSLITNAQRISDARDTLDGATELDQGLTAGAEANIVPTDGNGLVVPRTAGQVLNIVYLTGGAATAGGFFPSGVNGSINASTAG